MTDTEWPELMFLIQISLLFMCQIKKRRPTVSLGKTAVKNKIYSKMAVIKTGF